MNNLKRTMDRIRFYLITLGCFLGIEIPLFMLTYFHFFTKYKNIVIIFTLLMGIGAALFVFTIISKIINEDYEIKLLFDNTNYDLMASSSGDFNEKI